MMTNLRTQRFMDNIGPAQRVKWRDDDSNIIFEASLYEMTCALFTINQIYVSSQMVTFRDFLNEIPDLTTEITPDTKLEYLSRAWTFDYYNSYEYYDARLLDIYYEIDDTYKKDVVLLFEFTDFPRDVYKK